MHEAQAHAFQFPAAASRLCRCAHRVELQRAVAARSCVQTPARTGLGLFLAAGQADGGGGDERGRRRGFVVFRSLGRRDGAVGPQLDSRWKVRLSDEVPPCPAPGAGSRRPAAVGRPARLLALAARAAGHQALTVISPSSLRHSPPAQQQTAKGVLETAGVVMAGVAAGAGTVSAARAAADRHQAGLVGGGQGPGLVGADIKAPIAAVLLGAFRPGVVSPTSWPPTKQRNVPRDRSRCRRPGRSRRPARRARPAGLGRRRCRLASRPGRSPRPATGQGGAPPATRSILKFAILAPTR